MAKRKPRPIRPGGGTAELIAKIYAVVERIPAGRVATYGQVAALAGLSRRARLAGFAMRQLPEGSPLPWHRVVNAQGKVSRRSGLGLEEGYQRHLLEEEGVAFDERGRIDLDRFGWDPKSPRPARGGRRELHRPGRA